MLYKNLTITSASAGKLLIPQSHLLYGGRTVAVELQNRVIPAVAVEILRWHCEYLCFTGRRGGRRIIARSYNFFHFYVRRRNLTRRSHAVDRTVAVRPPYGHRTVPLRAPCVCLNICHKNYGCRRDRRPTATVRHHLKGRRAAAVFLSP